jgi:hypothetical protein
MFCAFIDFEKAFDKVWRDGLWYKLLLNNWPIIFWIHFITFVFVDGFYITHKPVIRKPNIPIDKLFEFFKTLNEKPDADPINIPLLGTLVFI